MIFRDSVYLHFAWFFLFIWTLYILHWLPNTHQLIWGSFWQIQESLEEPIRFIHLCGQKNSLFTTLQNQKFKVFIFPYVLYHLGCITAALWHLPYEKWPFGYLNAAPSLMFRDWPWACLAKRPVLNLPKTKVTSQIYIF